MIGRRTGGLGLALLAAACSPSEPSREANYNLPETLKEVSGLAVAGPDSVFTHNDEHAIVYEFRLRDGALLRTFAFGDPTLEGDFEGIAVAQGQVFLVTSDGLIYSAAPVENGKRVTYQVHDTGVGTRCEIEGLSQSPAPGELLLLCKRFRDEREEGVLEIYHWRIGGGHAEALPYLSLSLDRWLDKDERAEFRPSGLELDPKCGHLYVISARSHSLVMLDKSGNVVAHRRLKRSRHPQAEGITLMPDGRMVLADEGSPSRAGKLSVYEAPLSGGCGG